MRASKQLPLLQRLKKNRSGKQQKQKRLPKSNLEATAILHNIRSLQNVGAMFRTADAAGIHTLILSGYTPSPTDLLGIVRKEFAKTALGAERNVVWSHTKNIGASIRAFKQQGYAVYAIERTRNAKDIFSYTVKKPLVCIMGNEVRGLSKSVLGKCDAILFIPMRGKKESLNVSVAFGIAAYQLVRDKK